MSKIVTIIGNPKLQSKTSKIAIEISEQLVERLKRKEELVEHDVLELAPISSKLFEWGNEEVQQSIVKISQSDMVVVASPTYKATYTGLLKAFMDQIPQGGLNGKIAIPVMVGAAPQHHMAVDVFLTPLLMELGANCPLRGIYVLESKIDNLSELVKAWLDQVWR